VVVWVILWLNVPSSARPSEDRRLVTSGTVVAVEEDTKLCERACYKLTIFVVISLILVTTVICGFTRPFHCNAVFTRFAFVIAAMFGRGPRMVIQTALGDGSICHHVSEACPSCSLSLPPNLGIIRINNRAVTATCSPISLASCSVDPHIDNR
jgi:hypothetical protein